MKIKALSRYDGDTETRFGDCILAYDNSSLVVYDCGHSKHADEVSAFLGANKRIQDVHIVISHNDSDHTAGVLDLFESLQLSGHSVTVYSSLYLKSNQKIYELLNKDDGRRTKEATKRHILETFNNIEKIVTKANEYKFKVENATISTSVTSGCSIVGPTEDEFAAVVAKAVKDDYVSDIDGETVMNAASVQLKCALDDGRDALLCGDASPSYLPELSDYRVVQLPHHGKLDNAKAIFDKIEGRLMSQYTFLVSDNTGNSNGGSDALMESQDRKGKVIENTKRGSVEIEPKMFATVATARENHGLYL